MDNVTLFKKIFADPERFAKPVDYYLGSNSMPKVTCTKEDLKKYSFHNVIADKTESLCYCGSISPEIARSAYKCLKSNEDDRNVLVACKKEVDDVNRTLSDAFDKVKLQFAQYEQVRATCPAAMDEFLANQTDDNAVKFYSCFMPVFCTKQLTSALNCANKSRDQDLHGCESEIDEMIKCSIDKWMV